MNNGQFEENKTTTYFNSGIILHDYPRKHFWKIWKPKKREIGRRFPKQLEKKYVYYEKAQDNNGEWLKIGDKVKIINYSNNNPKTMNTIQTIKGIFQGDLMLGDPYFYCWPNNVVKL